MLTKTVHINLPGPPQDTWEREAICWRCHQPVVNGRTRRLDSNDLRAGATLTRYGVYCHDGDGCAARELQFRDACREWALADLSTAVGLIDAAAWEHIPEEVRQRIAAAREEAAGVLQRRHAMERPRAATELRYVSR